MRLTLLVLACSSPSWAAGLSIANVRVQQFDGGPAVLSPQEFQPGETVYFSFSATGVKSKDEAVKLSFVATAYDPVGVALAPEVSGKLAATLAPEDKEWTPVLRGSVALPPLLFAGKYRISVTLTDEIAAASIPADIPFAVGGPAPWGGDKLAIRGLAFYRSADEEKPLETAAYRLSEPIEARFEIAGFTRRPGQPLDVTWGYSLLDSAGKILHEEPAGAQDGASDFYPKAYIQAGVGLTLKPGTPPGEFTLVIVARDGLRSQYTEARAIFRIL